MKRASWFFGAALAFVVRPGLAAGPDSAAAEKLFMEARGLLAKGDYAAACPMLAESHRLEPAVGTLLNLAECYEGAGKTASAWAAYREMETLAMRLNQGPRAEHAASRARALEPSLSYVTIVVPQGARLAGLVTRRDGGEVGAASWGRELPVDPGPHQFVATAPNHRGWSAAISVSPKAHARLEVPVLKARAAPLLPPGPPPPGGSPLPAIGAVALGVGGAALVTGLVFGGIAWRKNATATRDHCSAADCDARGLDLIAQSRAFATPATVTVIAGAATMAVGTLLIILAPRSSARGANGIAFPPRAMASGGTAMELTF
jgi:serine/threonine-protein kinase